MKTTEEYVEEIVQKLKLLHLSKPNQPVCNEIRTLRLEGIYFEWPRPPESQNIIVPNTQTNNNHIHLTTNICKYTILYTITLSSLAYHKQESSHIKLA